MNIQSRRFHDAVKNRLCDDELLAAQQTDAAASGSAVASGNGARDGGKCPLHFVVCTYTYPVLHFVYTGANHNV